MRQSLGILLRDEPSKVFEIDPRKLKFCMLHYVNILNLEAYVITQKWGVSL